MLPVKFAATSLFCFNNLARSSGAILCGTTNTLLISPIRHQWSEKLAHKPKPPGTPGGKPGYYRRTVHYPDEYTLKPIPTTNLAGRDPVTGRVVVGTLGGGLKHPFLWVDYRRSLPEGAPPLIEKVLEIIVEKNRTAHVALVGHKDKLRYIIATTSMKPGDLISSSSEITRNAVRAKDGDSYPLGSLAIGTRVCCIEVRPGDGAYYSRCAGSSCTIIRKYDDRVVIMTPHKQEYALDQRCSAVVGQVSNVEHSSIPIGSANALRWLGYRPRSGLWHRKDGRHGRKIRKPPPCKEISANPAAPAPYISLTLDELYFHHNKYSKSIHNS